MIIYRLCSALPLQNRVVCISRQSDTIPVDFKLIAKEIEHTHPDFEVVILAKAIDNKLLYCFHIFKQIYYIATSRAIILDSYCIAVSLLDHHIKAPVVQMWHAMGNMKKFGYTALGEEEGSSFSTAQAFKMHHGYTTVLISSKSFIKDFAAGFNVDPSVIVEAPLPRADLLINPEYVKKERELLLSRFPQLQKKKNIVYCPTFRKNPAPNQLAAMKQLIDAIDFEKYNFIYKAHPVSSQRFEDERVLKDYGNYDMLYIADYVISDYSTVIYEAGLLDVPVYLYAYDWNTYQEKRSLNINIQEDVPTLFTNNAKEIMEAIESDNFNHQKYQQFIRNNISIPKDTSCTAHVVSLVFALINKRK